MKMSRFLEHHGLAANPFDGEDAQHDPIFRRHCIDSTYHPAWDKVYGDPAIPSTAIVFGEKGAGKTALRLQMVRRLSEFNRQHPDQRVFVVEYDDLNPFISAYCKRVGSGPRSLERWKLWDHLDAVLSLAVTRLVDQFLGVKSPQSQLPKDDPFSEVAIDSARLSRSQARDLLLLAACYDRSTAENLLVRWRRLRRRLHYRNWSSWWAFAVGLLVTLGVAGTLVGLRQWEWLTSPWPYVFVVAGWLPWLLRSAHWYLRAFSVARHLRVLNHETGLLRKVLASFPSDDLARQPMPNNSNSDDRYRLLDKLKDILAALGFPGVLVLVDRLDEPEHVNGDPKRMKDLLWPLLDNMLLTYQGLGFKMLVPIELEYEIDREKAEFYQRSRLDRQNLVRSLEWSGETLYDIASDRLRACAVDGQLPKLPALFASSIDQARLIQVFRDLRAPRHLFKFLNQLLVAHCNAYTDDSPQWQISGETFEKQLGLFRDHLAALDRGMGAG